MNREPFQNGEFYHIYNRGIDKRTIFNNRFDLKRFQKSMVVFNSLEPIGSMWLLNLIGEENKKKKKLVDIIAYCLNPNHYHMILKQNVIGGIAEFMKRLNGGYTYYFNFKNKRNGALFQGTFKSKLVHDNNYLLHLSAYVNLNYKVHQLRGETSQLIDSSWSEYTKSVSNICKTSAILKQFKDKKEYSNFAKNSLPIMLKRKEDEKELKSLLME